MRGPFLERDMFVRSAVEVHVPQKEVYYCSSCITEALLYTLRVH